MDENLSWKTQWQTLRRLHGRQRWAHLWAYYKLPLALLLVLLYTAGYATFRFATHKDVELYLALVNVSVGEETAARLTRGFLTDRELDEKKHEVKTYQGLTLSDSDGVDRQYVYAAEMKLLAAMNARQLDVVLMDETARDIFQRNGYLTELPGSTLALDVSSSPCLVQAGFCAPVYVGILANSPRMDSALDYVVYLTGQ